jgi:hypothetical protein
VQPPFVRFDRLRIYLRRSGEVSGPIARVYVYASISATRGLQGAPFAGSPPSISRELSGVLDDGLRGAFDQTCAKLADTPKRRAVSPSEFHSLRWHDFRHDRGCCEKFC